MNVQLNLRLTYTGFSVYIYLCLHNILMLLRRWREIDTLPPPHLGLLLRPAQDESADQIINYMHNVNVHLTTDWFI